MIYSDIVSIVKVTREAEFNRATRLPPTPSPAYVEQTTALFTGTDGNKKKADYFVMVPESLDLAVGDEITLVRVRGRAPRDPGPYKVMAVASCGTALTAMNEALVCK